MYNALTNQPILLHQVFVVASSDRGMNFELELFLFSFYEFEVEQFSMGYVVNKKSVYISLRFLWLRFCFVVCISMDTKFVNFLRV